MTNTEAPVQVTTSGAILCQGEEGVAIYMELSVLHSLSLEVATGMGNSRRVSVLQQANAISDQLDSARVYELTGIRLPGPWAMKRTKAGALGDLVLFLMLTRGYEPSDAIKRSLGDKLPGLVRRAQRILSKLPRE